MPETLYKVLSADGSACHGGSGKWSLPTKNADGSWQAGEWMPAIESPVLCERGYHLCRLSDLLKWLNETIWVAEYRGTRVDGGDKIVVPEARLLAGTGWNKRTARLFACDCAEHVLPIYDKARPNDGSVRDCIAVARRFANGKATAEELAAARDAAWAASWDAARDAAWAASWDAARDAARDAETTWQCDRLMFYLEEQDASNPS
jgi:hypothetical protein